MAVDACCVHMVRNPDMHPDYAAWADRSWWSYERWALGGHNLLQEHCSIAWINAAIPDLLYARQIAASAEWVQAQGCQGGLQLVPGGYCGPDSRGCCTTSTRCDVMPPKQCWAAGGCTYAGPVGRWHDLPIGSEYRSVDYPPTCAFHECALTSCCTDGRCRSVGNDETCIAGGGFVVPIGTSCQVVCDGREQACCLAGGCDDMSWFECTLRGGYVSGSCVSCLERPTCCPTPQPCCRCGECFLSDPAECFPSGGLSITGLGGSCSPEVQAICTAHGETQEQQCRFGLFTMVPAGDDPDRFDLLSTAPLNINEVPLLRLGHVDGRPWFCNTTRANGAQEYSEMGVAFNHDGALGDCVPPDYAGFIGGWQPECDPVTVP